jgi:hypothetical protein
MMAAAVRAQAQTTPADPAPPPPAQSAAPVASVTAGPGVTFLSRFDFHVAVAALNIADPRFAYDGHIGGDADLVDYGTGRLTFLADYEPVMGSEYRFFDPNQGTYTLESFLSLRKGATEIAGGFHHVSRHLSDRPKTFSVAWNEVGVRVMRRVTRTTHIIDLRAEVSMVTQRNYVDYTWTSRLDIKVTRPVRPAAALFVHGTEEVFGVDPTKAGRSTQNGGLIEAGVRLIGKAAAVELFAGYERRVDAYPLDRTALTWLMAGFRLTSK